MLADNQDFVDSTSNEVGTKGVFPGFNCCNQRTNSLITIPVVHPSCYENRIVFHNIQLQPDQDLDSCSEATANLGDLTRVQYSQLRNQNMFSGFNNRFNVFRKNVLDRGITNGPDLEDLNNNAEHEQPPVNSNFNLRGDENETSSHIDDLFENVSTDQVKNGPVCGLFGDCFNPPQNDVPSKHPSLNEMFRLTGAMSSFLEGPEFVDLETIESNVPANTLMRCLGCFKSGFGSLGAEKFSSIVSQSSLAPSDVGCFGECTKKLKRFVDVDKFSTLATASSFGLRNLYHSFSSFSQNMISPAHSFFESLPSHGVRGTNDYTKYFSMDNAKGQSSWFNPCSTPKVDEPPKLKPKYKNSRPNTFRLHAVEIHQYVPLPNLPSSRFVNEKTKPDQFKTNADSAYLANCFFNPNTTGPVAPMMANLMNGVDNYPDVYAMTNKVNRLDTQDLSMCVMPLDSNNGSHNQFPMTLVQ